MPLVPWPSPPRRERLQTSNPVDSTFVDRPGCDESCDLSWGDRFATIRFHAVVAKSAYARRWMLGCHRTVPTTKPAANGDAAHREERDQHGPCHVGR